MKNNPDQLLHNLLSALVSEWGFTEVNNKLQRIGNKALNQKIPRPGSSSNEQATIKSKINKISPKEYVEKIDTEMHSKEILYLIADGFEKKEFLNSISDVRHFLDNLGIRSENIKQRSDSFRTIINSIRDFPEEKLRSILKSLPLYGTTRLGPLSDAIREANNSIRSSSTPPENSNFLKTDKTK